MSSDTPSPEPSPQTQPAASPSQAMSVHGPLRPQLNHSGLGHNSYTATGDDRLTELPSLFRPSSYSRGSASHQRSPSPRNSLSTILNTTSAEDVDAETSPRRRKFPRTVQKMSSLPALKHSPLMRNDAPTLPRVDALDRSQRPMLTPKSPMQRSLSYANLRGSYTSAPGDVPPVPPIPPMKTAKHHDVSPTLYPTERALSDPSTVAVPHSQFQSVVAPSSQRPGIGAVARLEQQYRGSADSSPTMSRSSRSQQELSPPMTMSQMAQGHGLPQAIYAGQPGASSGNLSTHHVESAQSQSGMSNRTHYQVMNLQTSTGVVQLPVDVGMASKIANDKRRRNAGASARFRSRRKQREQIAQERIHVLEQYTADCKHAVDFYKAERDYFRDVLRAQCKEGSEKIFERAASPKAYLETPKVSTTVDPSVALRGESHSPAPSDYRSDSRLGIARHHTMSPRSVPASRSGLETFHHRDQSTRGLGLTFSEHDTSYNQSRASQPPPVSRDFHGEQARQHRQYQEQRPDHVPTTQEQYYRRAPDPRSDVLRQPLQPRYHETDGSKRQQYTDESNATRQHYDDGRQSRQCYDEHALPSQGRADDRSIPRQQPRDRVRDRSESQ